SPLFSVERPAGLGACFNASICLRTHSLYFSWPCVSLSDAHVPSIDSLSASLSPDKSGSARISPSAGGPTGGAICGDTGTAGVAIGTPSTGVIKNTGMSPVLPSSCVSENWLSDAMDLRSVSPWDARSEQMPTQFGAPPAV